MSRFGYLLFTVLISIFVYGFVYVVGGAIHKALEYMLVYFSLPLLVTNFLLAIFSLIRSYIHNQDEDIAREGGTFLHAIWITVLITFVAYQGMSYDFTGFLSSHHIHFR